MALPRNLIKVVSVHKDTAIMACKAVDVDVDVMDLTVLMVLLWSNQVLA
jgi:hypothetical protein